MNLGLLVEGHGEVQAVPILVRRIAATLELPCTILPPIRQPRTTTIKPGELERAVTLLGNKVGHGGAILVLLDADDDLACTLAPALVTRARRAARSADLRRPRSSRVRSLARRIGNVASRPTRAASQPRSTTRCGGHSRR